MLYYSLGELVDKLAVIHLKIWHIEEAIGIAKENNKPDESTQKLCDQVVSLNRLRMDIVDSINEYYQILLEKKNE